MSDKRKVTVKLRHNSAVKGAEGLPGDVVSVSTKQAQVWFDEGIAEPADRVQHSTNRKAAKAETRG